ncbi:MAG: hypothetical protein V3T83_21970, partial [Acidobacteriota bacterium]
ILSFLWSDGQVAGPESQAATLPRSLADDAVEMPSSRTPRVQGVKRFLPHETTAREVYQTAMSDSPREREKIVRNRWIPTPGWSGTVFSLPEKVDIPSSEWKWIVLVQEHGSATEHIIHIWTKDDASNLRVGDSVTVVGRIKDVRTGIVVLVDGEIRRE